MGGTSCWSGPAEGEGKREAGKEWARNWAMEKAGKQEREAQAPEPGFCRGGQFGRRMTSGAEVGKRRKWNWEKFSCIELMGRGLRENSEVSS